MVHDIIASARDLLKEIQKQNPEVELRSVHPNPQVLPELVIPQGDPSLLQLPKYCGIDPQKRIIFLYAPYGPVIFFHY